MQSLVPWKVSGLLRNRLQSFICEMADLAGQLWQMLSSHWNTKQKDYYDNLLGNLCISP